jgi:hypothetical protein
VAEENPEMLVTTREVVKREVLMIYTRPLALRITVDKSLPLVTLNLVVGAY